MFVGVMRRVRFVGRRSNERRAWHRRCALGGACSWRSRRRRVAGRIVRRRRRRRVDRLCWSRSSMMAGRWNRSRRRRMARCLRLRRVT